MSEQPNRYRNTNFFFRFWIESSKAITESQTVFQFRFHGTRSERKANGEVNQHVNNFCFRTKNRTEISKIKQNDYNGFGFENVMVYEKKKRWRRKEKIDISEKLRLQIGRNWHASEGTSYITAFLLFPPVPFIFHDTFTYNHYHLLAA